MIGKMVLCETIYYFFVRLVLWRGGWELGWGRAASESLDPSPLPFIRRHAKDFVESIIPTQFTESKRSGRQIARGSQYMIRHFLDEIRSIWTSQGDTSGLATWGTSRTSPRPLSQAPSIARPHSPVQLPLFLFMDHTYRPGNFMPLLGIRLDWFSAPNNHNSSSSWRKQSPKYVIILIPSSWHPSGRSCVSRPR